MANSLLTLNMITREALRLFLNENSFLKSVNRQYDDQFAKQGAKIGDTLRIRLPNDYTVRTGPVAAPQATNEQQTTLTMATQKGVDLVFSSVDQALSLDDFSTRILKPAINNLVANVSNDVMSMVEGACNFVNNPGAGGATTTPTAATIMQANALLTLNSAPMGSRKLVVDPVTNARVAASLTNLYNPVSAISEQYKDGVVSRAFGFSWMEDQLVIKHTTAAYGTLPTVNGANQTGTSITVTATTAPLNAGDIITIAGVYAVNRAAKVSTGQLRQFVVTQNVAVGATQVPIYPALIPESGGLPVQFQTVTASPASGAAIAVVNNASEVYRKNVAFVPEAFTMVTADLPMYGKGVVDAARESFDGVSMRMIQYYDGVNDNLNTRLDILYGYLMLRPEWACVIADAL